MFGNVNKIFEKVQNCDLFSPKNVHPKAFTLRGW